MSPDRSGRFALHYAALNGTTRIVEYLVGKGAKMDVKNKQGKTAVELARGATAELLKKKVSATQ